MEVEAVAGAGGGEDRAIARVQIDGDHGLPRMVRDERPTALLVEDDIDGRVKDLARARGRIGEDLPVSLWEIDADGDHAIEA